MEGKNIFKKTTPVSAIGELGLIKRFRARCRNDMPGIFKGIGDDAAAVDALAGKMLIASDMMIEGVHFDLSYTTFYQLGYKILAVNISDIFAMGGIPKYFLLSLGIPAACNSGSVDELYSGMMKIADKFGIAVIGGDTCTAKRGFVLSGTLVGYADRVITRSGARIGDGIFVTNTLGDSAMGLKILKKMGRKELINLRDKKYKTKNTKLKLLSRKFIYKGISPLLKRHLMPVPEPLDNTSAITSMIDISDGLLMDLSHLCDESKTGALIYRDDIPVSDEFQSAAKNFSVDPIDFAMKGGEDYALLFTALPNITTDAFRIGEVVRKGRFIVDERGRKTPFRAEGYEHFK